MSNPVYRGVFPVAPTVFDEKGELDLEGQKRCIDFMIDAGSEGICILANWSEQFVLTDAERDRVMECVLRHVAGRVPVIVTTTHFGTAVCAERSLFVFPNHVIASFAFPLASASPVPRRLRRVSPGQPVRIHTRATAASAAPYDMPYDIECLGMS